LSRILNVATALLVIFGIWPIVWGLMVLFTPEWYIEMSGVTVSQIRAFSQDLLDSMIFTTRFFGLCGLSAGLFVCVVSLIPYRKGKKWAWYTMLIIGGVLMSSYLLVLWTVGLEPFPMIFVILWILGLALPAKEILGKP
jgi:hypothetical protein